jgi:hypothetical protein
VASGNRHELDIPALTAAVVGESVLAHKLGVLTSRSLA